MNTMIWILVGCLLFLRIPFLGGVRTFFPASEVWAAPVFEIGTYLLTALGVWLVRDHLAEYHLHPIALVILVVGKPLELLLQALHLPFDYPAHSSAILLYLPISLALGIALLLQRPRLPRVTGKDGLWLAAGALAGITFGILIGFLIREFGAAEGLIFSQAPLSKIFSVPVKLLVFLPLQQALYAGIAEEPLFRGFLWGALHKAGWKDGWIWLTQAGLFWLAHFYYFRHANVSFWLTVPLGGLLLGFIAWRSRSIAASLLAHGCYNGFGQIVMFYL
jgi:membrane protease YdiL (CAAX protease family)